MPADVTPQDHERARAIVCEWCRSGEPLRADRHHATGGGMNRCAAKWRGDDVEAIATALAEQREQIEPLAKALHQAATHLHEENCSTGCSRNGGEQDPQDSYDCISDEYWKLLDAIRGSDA